MLLESEILTVPVVESIAKVTIMLLRAFTPAAGTVMEMDVPEVLFWFVPMFLTKATAASAEEVDNSHAITAKNALTVRSNLVTFISCRLLPSI